MVAGGASMMPTFTSESLIVCIEDATRN
jgi:hypothetical protein